MENLNATIDIVLDKDGFGKLSVLAMERSDGHVENSEAFCGLITEKKSKKQTKTNKEKKKQKQPPPPPPAKKTEKKQQKK